MPYGSAYQRMACHDIYVTFLKDKALIFKDEYQITQILASVGTTGTETQLNTDHTSSFSTLKS